MSTLLDEEKVYQNVKNLSRNMCDIKVEKVMYPDGACSSKRIRLKTFLFHYDFI